MFVFLYFISYIGGRSINLLADTVVTSWSMYIWYMFSPVSYNADLWQVMFHLTSMHIVCTIYDYVNIIAKPNM